MVGEGEHPLGHTARCVLDSQSPFLSPTSYGLLSAWLDACLKVGCRGAWGGEEGKRCFCEIGGPGDGARI